MHRTLPRLGIVLLVAVTGAPAQSGREPGSASVRAELAEMYAIWGRARVEVDRPTLEALLGPDFRLLLDGKTSSRTEFLDQVTQTGSVRLTRFDVEILTLKRTGATWTAVIAEKLEWELRDPDGAPRKICDLWVTRDVCSKEGEGWRFHSSEAIGNENWPPGVTPPVRTW